MNKCDCKWSIDQVSETINMQLFDLMSEAHKALKQNFNDRPIQISTLLNIKKGGCSEDCKFCSQSAHHKINLEKTKLPNLEEVRVAVKNAKKIGSDRFCIAAAWRGVHDNDIDKLKSIISIIKEEGMESCASLGILKDNQAKILKESGLDFYNHNIESSREFYEQIVTTHTFEDRLKTIQIAQDAGLKICCGGIIGMGESKIDRIKMIHEIININPQPQSIPINILIPIDGTKIGLTKNTIEPFDIIRTIATIRIFAPQSYIRLSAGRSNMSNELQAMCMFSGANSIFYGDYLLTVKNNSINEDKKLMEEIGINVKILEI